jgi:hypothetical protein
MHLSPQDRHRGVCAHRDGLGVATEREAAVRIASRSAPADLRVLSIAWALSLLAAIGSRVSAATGCEETGVSGAYGEWSSSVARLVDSP